MPDDERLFWGVSFQSHATRLAASARRGQLAIDARATSDERKATMNRSTPKFLRAKPALGIDGSIWKPLAPEGNAVKDYFP